jgi:hypothetical protein
VCRRWHSGSEWAADAYQKKYRATVWEFRHASWDEVFGKPHPPNAKLPARRQAKRLQWSVYVRMKDHLATEASVEEAIEVVAAQLKIPEARVKRYYDACRHWLSDAWALHEEVQKSKSTEHDT